MNADDNEPPEFVEQRRKRWKKRFIAIAVLAAALFLPAVELYIRATSFSPESATALLWRQRVSLYNDAYPPNPLFSAVLQGASKQYCYIDANGKVVIPGPFRFALSFSEGLASVATIQNGEERWGVIDTTGSYVIQPVFDRKIGSFHDGLSTATGTDLLGYYSGFLDQSGDWAVKLRCQHATAMVNGIAQVNISPPSHWFYGILCGDCGLPPRLRFINKNGNFLNASDLRDFDVNKAPPVPIFGDYQGDPVEFRNGDGKNVFGRKYESANGFSNGLAPAKDNGLWGYIDTQGEFVIPPQYHEAQMFRNGYAAVRPQKSGKFGLIDTNGNLVIPAQYNWITEFRDGLLEVTAEQNGRAYWAYINLNNEQIWPPISHQSGANKSP